VRLRSRCAGLALAIAGALASSGAPTTAGAVESTPPPNAQAQRCVTAHVDATYSGMPAFRDCSDTPVMVALPSGRFEMGDRLGNGGMYEHPVHSVELGRFALSRYEVTRREWAACVRAAACAATATSALADDMPITGVSWDQVTQYAAWISQRSGQRYRLPSEAEWEYAARAGVQTRYPWGNSVEPACEYVNGFDRRGHEAHPQWYWQIECDDGYGDAAPVGRYAPNAWGFYDMLGNVWEWVADCWHSSYDGAPGDGSAWVEDGCRKRVNRGGGWGNHPRSLTLSNRDGDEAKVFSDGLGFRVARDLP
jgi:formylglycine-generating enzyme required for sulfatase activity